VLGCMCKGFHEVELDKTSSTFTMMSKITKAVAAHDQVQ
jgi:hypothetical protein